MEARCVGILAVEGRGRRRVRRHGRFLERVMRMYMRAHSNREQQQAQQPHGEQLDVLRAALRCAACRCAGPCVRRETAEALRANARRTRE